MPSGTTFDTMRRWDRVAWSDWLVPAVVAALWAVAVAASAREAAALPRSLVFVGGPIVLLAGMHARLSAYLHADSRRVLLPLPIAPRLHFASALARHHRSMAATVVAGTAGLAVVVLTEPAASVMSASQRVGLLFDFVWLVAIAAVLEPAVPAVSAYLGRRVPEHSTAARLQVGLGGGWTIPEAVVHLYAPAAGIGLAAGLAMPGQLLADRVADAQPWSPTWLAVAVGGLAIAVALRLAAPRFYAAGLFGSVPWVVEATRTLAGPPIPEDAPRWLALVRDPALRLWLLQLWRITPVPTLRLLALLGWTAYLAGSSSAPDVPRLAVLGASCALWLVPASAVARLRPVRARLFAPLPLRADTVDRRGWTLLATPAAVACIIAGLRIGGMW